MLHRRGVPRKNSEPGILLDEVFEVLRKFSGSGVVDAGRQHDAFSNMSEVKRWSIDCRGWTVLGES